jgi:hypothetical protein
MGVMLSWKKNTILDVSGGVFEDLYFIMLLDVIEKNKLILSPNLLELFKYLELGLGGSGLDIANYIKSKEDMIVFIGIIEEAVDIFKQNNPKASQYTKDNLENFYKELVKVSEPFEPKKGPEMSTITWKGKDILTCESSIINRLTLELENILGEKDYLNIPLAKQFERLVFAGYGYGFALSDYVYSKEDFISFMNLIRKGIDKYYHATPDVLHETKDLLENFYKELVKIEESFSI